MGSEILVDDARTHLRYRSRGNHEMTSFFVGFSTRTDKHAQVSKIAIPGDALRVSGWVWKARRRDVRKIALLSTVELGGSFDSYGTSVAVSGRLWMRCANFYHGVVRSHITPKSTRSILIWKTSFHM